MQTRVGEVVDWFKSLEGGKGRKSTLVRIMTSKIILSWIAGEIVERRKSYTSMKLDFFDIEKN